MSDVVANMQRVLDDLGLGDDPEMKTTAERFTTFLGGYAQGDAAPSLTVCAAQTHDPVIVRNVQFYSLCAHHLLPFFGHVTVAYTPDQVVAGLGSIPKFIRYVARKPQIQEQLVERLANQLWDAIQPKTLVVVAEARHLCVEMHVQGAAMPVDVIAMRGDGAEALRDWI
jgi:GTP cyclohydrolase I